MKMNNTSKILGVLVAAGFTASLSFAQGTIADDELLQLLEGATTNEPAAEVEQPEVQPEAIPAEPAVPAEEGVPAEEPEPAAATEEAAVEEAAEEVLEDSVTVEVGAEEQPEAEEVEESDVDSLGMASAEEAGEASGELISVRLNKVGLEEAINLFAQLSGANIIVPELTEAAQISVNLKDVEWRPALQSILDSYNYELYQKVSGSNVYSVRRRPVGAPEPQVVETFKLRYATVPNAAELVRALLPEDAKVSEFASRNMIVVKSTESSLSEVRSVLQSIDTIRQQVFIESKFMELTDSAQKDLGIDWQVLQAYQAGASDLSSSFVKTDKDGTDTSRLFDMAGNQVEAAGAPEYVDDGAGGVERFQEIIPSMTKNTEKAVNQISTAVLSADDFNVILSALEQTKGVNVVSNPKIIVANEESANISIVRKEPNLKEERKEALNDTGDNVTFSLDPDQPFFEFGIKLDVIPSINTASNITVDIKPSLTRRFGEKAAGENNSFPIIDEKTIETVFNLTSGQTAAIGGLTEVTDSEEERKIPLLGSIPYLGRLFSWTQTISDQRETIIFVTVGLANTQDIDSQSGLPEDSELARRRLIRDKNTRALRAQSRDHFEAKEDESLQDTMEEAQQKEDKRLEKRAKQLAKASE